MNAQRVDPFIPVQTPRLYPGLVNNIPRQTAQQPKRMDVARPAAHASLTARHAQRSALRPPTSAPTPPRLRQTLSVPQPALRAKPAEPAPQTKSSKPKPKHRLLRALRTPALGLLIMLAGVVVQTAAFGEAAIGVYALMALWRRIPSCTTFLMALLSLVGVVALLLIKTNDALAATFTIYTFLLLAVGVLCLLREMRFEDA